MAHPILRSHPSPSLAVEPLPRPSLGISYSPTSTLTPGGHYLTPRSLQSEPKTIILRLRYPRLTLDADQSRPVLLAVPPRGLDGPSGRREHCKHLQKLFEDLRGRIVSLVLGTNGKALGEG